MKPKIQTNRSLTPAAILSRLNEVLPPKRYESGSEITMIIDGHNMAYQAKHAYERLSFGGKSVSVMFGVPSIIKGLIKEKRPTKIVVAWDGKRSEHRLSILPEYKGHREAKREPKERELFLKQIDRTQKLLHYMGVTQAYDDSIEGDDLIYMLVQHYQKRSKVLIVSADKDFNQLINFDVSVYNQRTKITQDTFAFLVDQGVELPQFVDYLCLIGDSSDDIPGYYGCGPATARKFLKKYWSIKQYLNHREVFAGLTDKERLEEIYKRNRMLIDLKRFNKRFIGDMEIPFYKGTQFPKFNEDKYKEFCVKFGFKSFMLPDFKNTFKNL